MKKNLLISVRMTLVTTVLLGVIYPLVITGLAQWFFPWQANGELTYLNGQLIGSKLIGQPFTAPGYFHSRPSAAGPAGYDATASGGSNLGPTNKILVERVEADIKKYRSENPGIPVPVDLVTSSGSGLDPDVSPAAAEFQVPRVASERGMSQSKVRALIKRHIKQRQFDFLGEPRVNVLELNLDLDALHPRH